MKMASRRRNWKRIVAILALIALLVGYWLWPREALTDEMLAKLRPNMSLAELKQVLGEPLSQADYPVNNVGLNWSKDRSGHVFLEDLYFRPTSVFQPIYHLQVHLEALPKNTPGWHCLSLLERGIPGSSYRVWPGRTKTLLAEINEQGYLGKYWIFPSDRSEGLAVWLSKKWEEWNKPAR
jgi:hypothetical protein